MNRYRQHVPVFQERTLLGVTVVHVPIDDRDAFKFVDLPRTTRDQNIVCENAITPPSVSLGVVAWGADEAIRISNVPVHDRVQSGKAAACSQRSDLKCSPANRRELTGFAADSIAQTLDQPDILA